MQRFIQTVARQAGTVARRRFGRPGAVTTKRHVGDVVTAVDRQINRLIVQKIRTAYPGHGILSEEQDGYHTLAEFLWIIDPLDGTRNFVAGTPLFGVMIGLAHRGVMRYAVVCDPMNDRLYVAHRGHGAMLNGKRIHCSKTKAWAHSFGCGMASLNAKKMRYLKPLLLSAAHEPFAMSAFGSAAISAAHVADGRRDWCVSIEAGVWDYAIPALLLQESGCIVTNFYGQRWTLNDREMVAANPHLHPKLLRLLNGGRP
ncbi:MAG: inositol monophosphatase [Patescibacteria group bacterium]|nr:inositol monophosphatase [Patescibacteria group bacterium]